MALKLGDLVAYLRADDGPLKTGLAKAKTRISGFGDELKTGLKAAGGAAAAGMGAAIATGLAQNLDIGAGRAKLAAQLDLTKEESAKYGELAGKVYAGNYGESLTAVNDAIKSVVHNVGDVGTLGEEGFQKATEAALTLSDTMGVDVGATTEAVAKMIRNGLVKTPQEAFDVLTKGFQDGADRSGDFLETLNEYSPQFAKLGIDGDTALNILSKGLKAGARDTDVIADAFKEFSLRAIDGSDATKKAYKDLGMNAKTAAKDIAAGGDTARERTQKVIDALSKMKDPVKQNEVGVALFGTQWEDTLRQILPAMDGVLDKSVEVTGATDRMTAAAGDSGAARIETFRRGIETWIQTQTSASGAMGTTVAGLAEFGPGALTAAGSIGMMVSGLAALNAGAALTAVRTGIVTAATGAWTAVQWLLNAALTANPIGIIIVLVAALVAGIVIAYKRSDKFRAVVQAAMKGVVKAFGWLWDKAKAVWGWLKGAFSKAKDYITAPIREGIRRAIDHFRDMNRRAREIPGKIKDAFGRANTLLASAGRNVVIGLWNGIKGMSGWLKDTLIGWAKSAIPDPIAKALGIASPSRVMMRYGRWVGEGLLLGVQQSGPGVQRAAERLADRIKAAKDRLAELRRTASDYANSIRTSFVATGALSGVQGADGAAVGFGDISAALSGAAARAERFRTVIAQLRRAGLNKASLRELLEAGPGALEQALATASGGASGIRAINGYMRRIGAAGKSAGKSAARDMYGAGIDAAAGMVQGLKKAIPAVVKAARRLGKEVARAVKKALGIASPSKVGRMLGGYFGQGMGLGIDDERRGVEAAAGRLARAAIPSQTALGAIPRQRTGAGAGGARGGPAQVEFVGDQAFVDFMRKIVKVKGQGSVEVAFGTTRGGAPAGAR